MANGANPPRHLRKCNPMFHRLHQNPRQDNGYVLKSGDNGLHLRQHLTPTTLAPGSFAPVSSSQSDREHSLQCGGASKRAKKMEHALAIVDRLWEACQAYH